MGGTPTRVLLLRPPRYVWPFNGETSAFWQPLGLLCLAAAVRRDLPDVRVEVWDCPAGAVGWRTLAKRLTERRIDVLGIGEETVSAHEALRAAATIRRLNPDCMVVAGGVYFAHAVEVTLATGLVDVIVRGEGERTFVDLLAAGPDRDRWRRIPGLAFRDEHGRILRTRPRELVENLDDLPMPAYDLIDMGAYGRSSRNHPDLASIEHSRGCVDSCHFCILWKHMGRSADGGAPKRGFPRLGTPGRVRPCWRTKSPRRSFEEVRWLHRRFGRRTFGWVDPTFNVSPDWSDAWAERMLTSDMMDPRGRPRAIHTAWMRADGIIRDEKLGVLGKLVRAGLRQVMIGVERDEADGLAALGKHGNGPEVCREAFAILRGRYPQVYTIGTMIFGLPGDTLADLDRLSAAQYEMGMDYCFLMPLTPNPGTAVAEEASRAGRIASGDLACYNFHTPVCTTDSLDLRRQESIYWRLMLRLHPRRLARAARQLLAERDRRKRRVHLALLRRGTTIAVKALVRAATRPRCRRPALYSRKPPWYDN